MGYTWKSYVLALLIAAAAFAALIGLGELIPTSDEPYCRGGAEPNEVYWYTGADAEPVFWYECP